MGGLNENIERGGRMRLESHEDMLSFPGMGGHVESKTNGSLPLILSGSGSARDEPVSGWTKKQEA